MRAVRGEAQLTSGSPDGCAKPFARTFAHHSGVIAAGCARQSGLLETTLHVGEIAWIEARGSDFDQRFSDTRCGTGSIFEAQVLETGPFKTEPFHSGG